jgi:hypothetical protein
MTRAVQYRRERLRVPGSPRPRGRGCLRRMHRIVVRDHLIDCRDLHLPAANRAPVRITCQRARKTGVRRSNSAQSAFPLLAAGSNFMAIVAAIRNLAERRFSATSGCHDNEPRIAGSFQMLSLARSLIGPALRFQVPGPYPAMTMSPLRPSKACFEG